jgi:4-aminobutyrate aminotransferase-like enzyme/Ser/Thr protein kinase RdoA (MazF antagonist)
VVALASERDQNFRLRVGPRELVLKIANPAELAGVLDFEIRALAHVAACDPSLAVPRVLTTPAGETCPAVTGPDGRRHLVRLVTWLPGRVLAEAQAAGGAGAPLLRHVGETAARLGRALRGFFHPAAGRDLHWSLPLAARLRAHVGGIADAGARDLADRSLARFESHALPGLARLRAQVIHNDVSRHNTLVDPARERVAGIIDFGDMLHAPLACDAAVTVSEMMLGAPDPIGAAVCVAAGYREVEPLHEAELAVLPDLVAARLAMGLAISAWRIRRHPENAEYIAGDDALVGAALAQVVAGEAELRGALLAGGSARRGTGAAAPAPVPPTAASTDALLARRARLLGPALSHFYERPLQLVSGRGVWLVDASGRAYLDAYNNVPHVGHGHPAVVEAIARQAARLNTNTRYLTTPVLDHAERLIARFPAPLSVCLFVCSGSEANDLAWRLARLHTGARGALVVEGAYHGTTDAVHDLSPYDLPPGAAPAPHVRTLPVPDDYRGAHRRGEPGAGERYAAHADAAIASLREADLAPAAFFVDPILSSSGIFVPPAGWLSGVFARVRAAGGVCVSDEVQAGFGRTGSHWWGFEAHGVVPDIVTLGKPIGNGQPLAAVVTTPAIAASLARAGEFFSSFGGNSVSCAAGLAVLDVIEREGLVENARRVGGVLREGLEALAKRHPAIGDVRGAGLFVGVELVRDRATREPAARETRAVIEQMREAGVLVGSDGPHGNVLKIRPPMVFGAGDAARLLEALDAALGAVYSASTSSYSR